MSSVMPFAFNAVELYVVTVNGKPWIRAKEVCKALEYGENAKSKDVLKKHVSIENKQHQYQRVGHSNPTIKLAKKQSTIGILPQ